MRLDVRFDDRDIQQAFQRVMQLGMDSTPITRAVAAVLASESEDAFARQADPSTGQPWTPLTPRYKAKLDARGHTGPMLQRTQGGLALSLSTTYDAVSAAMGSIRSTPRSINGRPANHVPRSCGGACPSLYGTVQTGNCRYRGYH